MRAEAQFALCLVLALGVHAAALALLPPVDVPGAAGSEGGGAAMSGADAGLVAMVESWEAPPEIGGQEIAAPAEPAVEPLASLKVPDIGASDASPLETLAPDAPVAAAAPELPTGPLAAIIAPETVARPVPDIPALAAPTAPAAPSVAVVAPGAGDSPVRPALPAPPSLAPAIRIPGAPPLPLPQPPPEDGGVATAPAPAPPVGLARPEARPDTRLPDAEDPETEPVTGVQTGPRTAPRPAERPARRPESTAARTPSVERARPAPVAPAVPAPESTSPESFAFEPPPGPAPALPDPGFGSLAPDPDAGGGTPEGGTAAADGGGGPDLAALRRDYAAEVAAAVGRQRSYPDRARARGVQGTVRLRLVIGPGGRLLSSGIAASSGDATLDDAALAAARAVGTYPQAPDDLPGYPFAFEVPVEFRLN